MDLTDRYIYAVTKRLPERQRDDIAKELRGLIEDMLAQRTDGAAADEKDVEAVLRELGDPAVLAAKYAGKPRYLIGPQLFDTYVLVLKIVLAAAAFGTLIAMSVGYAVSPPRGIGQVFENIIVSVFEAAVQGFAWVTVIFAIIEHHTGDSDMKKWGKNGWSPADLPEIPPEKARIKPSEPIVGMVFIVCFFILLNFNPGLFAYYSSASGIRQLPIFDLVVLKSYLWLIDIGFAVSIFKEILKLICGRYSIRYAVSAAVLSTVSLLIAVIVFSNFHIWNWNFVPCLLQASALTLPKGYTAVRLTTRFAQGMLGIFIFVYLLEMLSIAVKTLRWGTSSAGTVFQRKK